MKSRKVGANKKLNATKRNRASKIVKSKKKKLNKRKRRTRKRTRRQRGGNADFVVVVIGTHGSHCTISDGVMDQQRVPPGMNIRKINAAPLGMVNKTSYNDIKSETNFIAYIVQMVWNYCKENCDLSSAALELASRFKKYDEYSQNRDFLQDDINISKNWLRHMRKFPELYKRKYYTGKNAYDEQIKKLTSNIKEEELFMNKADQRFQIEIINDEHPIYFDKEFSTVGEHDIMLFEDNKKAVNITNEVLGRLQTRNWDNLKASQIYNYLASIGKYNVIIVDLSCSVVKYGNEGFTDRDIRHLNWKQKQDGSLLNNPYKHDWQNERIKKKRKREVTIPEESEREVTIPEESEREVTIPEESESFMVPEF
jgi:hypothetical protein